MVKIRVPATSANVGCGFDTLGIALNLYTTFTFEEIEEGVIFEGCEPKFANEDNLIYTSFLTTLKRLGKTVSGVKITIDCHVPVSRGLGSSSTCVVGGIYGAYALTHTPIDRNAIFTLASAIEGHPDNVSPAIFGGLSASCMVGDEAITLAYAIDERFQFLALIPNFETLTANMREVLPEMVKREDAIYTLSRLGVVLKAFEQYDLDVLSKVMDDKLHEPYRKHLIHEYEEVKQICQQEDSVCFMISGSGSTLLNIVRTQASAECIQAKLKTLQFDWQVKCLRVDTCGSVVVGE